MAQRWRRIAAMIALFSILSVLIAACGGGGDSGAEQGAATAAGAVETAAGEAAEAVETAAGEGAEAVETAAGEGAEAVETAAGEAAETAAAEGGEAETAATAEGGTGESGAAAAPTLPENCQNVQLAYWNPFTGPDGPFMGQMTDAFNAEQGGNIQVTMTTQSEYYTQIETAAAAQQLPDIAIMHADQVPKWAFRGVIRPMDDVASQIGVQESDFPEAVWAAGDIAGSRYSIPLDVHPMTMFYNQDLLTAAGINEPPQTREDFEAAAQAMTADGNNGFLLTTGFPVQQIFSMLLHQFGGTWFNEDGTEVTWNSEAGVQALEWMRTAQTTYGQENLEVDAELNAFKGGTVGMIWNGIWQTPNVTGEGVEFAGMATAVPQIGDQPAVWAGSHQFVLPARAGEADECRDAAAAIFIRYMLDNSETWARAGQLPANNEVREGLSGAQGGAEGDNQGVPLEMIAAIAPSAENAIFPPAVPGITDAFPPLDEAVGAIMSGQATDIQAALDDAANRANQILQENATTYGEAPPQQ